MSDFLSLLWGLTLRWSLIAGRIPGRTDNEIKNYWNTHLSKKLISQGIDPRTHRPLNPNPNSPEVGHGRELISKPKANRYSTPVVFEETGGNSTANGIQSDTNQLEGGHDLVVNDCMMGIQSGCRRGNEEDYIENCNELDTFSSFLDSLINDSMFLNQQQQQPNFHPLVCSSSAQTINHGNTIWEAELRSSIDTSSEEQSALNNHPA